jgi:hypothetical protein
VFASSNVDGWALLIPARQGSEHVIRSPRGWHAYVACTQPGQGINTPINLLPTTTRSRSVFLTVSCFPDMLFPQPVRMQ